MKKDFENSNFNFIYLNSHTEKKIFCLIESNIFILTICLNCFQIHAQKIDS